MSIVVHVPDQGTVGTSDKPGYAAKKRVRDIRNGLVSIRDKLLELRDLVQAAYDERDWEALGYESWEAYLAGAYSQEDFPRLKKADRDALAVELYEHGMSLRAIAPVVGAAKSTVHSAVSAAEVSSSGHLNGDSEPETETCEVTVVEPEPAEPATYEIKVTGPEPAGPKVRGLDGRQHPRHKAGEAKRLTIKTRPAEPGEGTGASRAGELTDEQLAQFRRTLAQLRPDVTQAMQQLLAFDPAASGKAAAQADDEQFVRLLEELGDWRAEAEEAFGRQEDLQ